MGDSRPGVYEFFAGGGMARLGLGEGWRTLFANDLCEKKAAAYRANFPPADEFVLRDVRDLRPADLPGAPVLAWASFPCQDLSLAGAQRGLHGERSGTFWAFWRLMEWMEREGRGVPMIVLENVVGALSSNGGRDFQNLFSTLAEAGYRVGPLVMNASHFLPQSRPRLFILAVRGIPDEAIPAHEENPEDAWRPQSIRKAWSTLPRALAESWLWWRLPLPEPGSLELIDLLEDSPSGVNWHTPAETRRLLDLMSPLHLSKIEEVRRSGVRRVGTLFKRTRRTEDGGRVQRAEVRFDGVSGCLRTPVGGSSRQVVLVVEGDAVRSRLLSPRETARLMGVPESYRLPSNANEGYHLMGDGLAVPVVSWLEEHLLVPMVERLEGGEGACRPARSGRREPVSAVR